VTIPVSPKSRYTAVYRSSKKYRETAQVSRVSTIPRVSDHWATSSLQAYDAKTNVIKSLTVKHCASSSHSVISQNFRTGTCKLVFDDPRWRGLSSRTTYLYGSWPLSLWPTVLRCVTWRNVFSRPYLVRSRLCYSVASVCRLYGMYCG